MGETPPHPRRDKSGEEEEDPGRSRARDPASGRHRLAVPRLWPGSRNGTPGRSLVCSRVYMKIEAEVSISKQGGGRLTVRFGFPEGSSAQNQPPKRVVALLKR